MRRNSSCSSKHERWNDLAGPGYAEKGIDEVVLIHEGKSIGTELHNYSGITHQHWEKSLSKTVCFNKKCNKKFSIFVRTKNCRRCGVLFCKECVAFQRRLDRLANLDPDGKLYPVCESCFGQDTQEIGVVRNLWRDFQGVKRRQQSFSSSHRSRGWRQRFDLRRECTRLTSGFMQIKRSSGEVGRALRDLSHLVSVPQWQKAYCWLQEDLSTTCGQCERAFSVWVRKHHCRVCGIVVCGSCSNRDLIVYIPDDPGEGDGGGDDDGDGTEARLAMIKIVGSPEVEPSLCLYLRVCLGCVRRLIDLQVTSHITPDCSQPLTSKLTEKHEQLMDVRDKIETHLSEYQRIIESLDDNSKTSSSDDGSGRSNIKTLAKAQTDLSDFFTHFIMSLQHLKQLKPLVMSSTQAKLLNNFIKSTCDFYLDNVSVFRMHQHTLEEVCRTETLEVIQRIMDKDAIACAHFYLRQLSYEALYLSTKHSILPHLPQTLVSVETVVEKEAETCIVGEGEDWDQQQELMQLLVQSQIKEHHRLIRPSRRLTHKLGANHVRDVTLLRTLDVLMKVRLQLSMKTTHRKFPATKSALLAAFTDVEASTRL